MASINLYNEFAGYLFKFQKAKGQENPQHESCGEITWFNATLKRPIKIGKYLDLKVGAELKEVTLDFNESRLHFEFHDEDEKEEVRVLFKINWFVRHEDWPKGEFSVFSGPIPEVLFQAEFDDQDPEEINFKDVELRENLYPMQEGSKFSKVDFLYNDMKLYFHHDDGDIRDSPLKFDVYYTLTLDEASGSRKKFPKQFELYGIVEASESESEIKSKPKKASRISTSDEIPEHSESEEDENSQASSEDESDNDSEEESEEDENSQASSEEESEEDESDEEEQSEEEKGNPRSKKRKAEKPLKKDVKKSKK